MTGEAETTQAQADANTAIAQGDPAAQQTSQPDPAPQSAAAAAQAEGAAAEAGAPAGDGVSLTSASNPGAQGIDPAALEETEIEVKVPAFEDSDHPGSPIGEEIMQRLRYFENLAAHMKAHIHSLKGVLGRHGIAAPRMPHFPPLRSVLGHHDANDHT